MKLESITESDKPGKKWTAVFIKDNGKTKTVHFGQATADDYTLSKDKAQRDRYRTRHQKDLETGDPTRAGFLSYYILWGDSTNLRTNIKKYVKKFNL
jgi:hypothetical protein